MDFSMVSLDNFMRSSNSASENAAKHNNHKWYGSGFLKQKRTTIEDDYREYYNKVAKTSSTTSSLSEDHQQMLSFSSSNSQTVALPYYHHTSSKSTGMNSSEMHGLVSRIGGPFTTSQWMELEHQALIYKYIIANVPIPSYLLNPIRKALESADFSGFSGLRSNALGWGGFHLGFANTDPEPGRCRRTDGKKWRCSRDAVAEQKYCERHINRGRHRSRKPVEGHTASVISMTNANNLTLTSKDNAYGRYQNPPTILSTTSAKVSLKDNPNAYNESCRPEFGSVCYDSLLNPLNSSSSLVNSRLENLNEHSNKSHHALRQFMDEWPKKRSQHSVTSDLTSMTASPSRLSRELEATQMGLGVGTSIIEQSQKQTSWVWETSRGPLGEVLHTGGECKQIKVCKQNANLIESPNRAYGSLSNSTAASSLSYGYIGSGLMHSSAL